MKNQKTGRIPEEDATKPEGKATSKARSYKKPKANGKIMVSDLWSKKMALELSHATRKTQKAPARRAQPQEKDSNIRITDFCTSPNPIQASSSFFQRSQKPSKQHNDSNDSQQLNHGTRSLIFAPTMKPQINEQNQKSSFGEIEVVFESGDDFSLKDSSFGDGFKDTSCEILPKEESEQFEAKSQQKGKGEVVPSKEFKVLRKKQVISSVCTGISIENCSECNSPDNENTRNDPKTRQKSSSLKKDIKTLPNKDQINRSSSNKGVPNKILVNLGQARMSQQEILRENSNENMRSAHPPFMIQPIVPHAHKKFRIKKGRSNSPTSNSNGPSRSPSSSGDEKEEIRKSIGNGDKELKRYYLNAGSNPIRGLGPKETSTIQSLNGNNNETPVEEINHFVKNDRETKKKSETQTKNGLETRIQDSLLKSKKPKSFGMALKKQKEKKSMMGLNNVQRDPGERQVDPPNKEPLQRGSNDSNLDSFGANSSLEKSSKCSEFSSFRMSLGEKRHRNTSTEKAKNEMICSEFRQKSKMIIEKSEEHLKMSRNSSKSPSNVGINK